MGLLALRMCCKMILSGVFSNNLKSNDCPSGYGFPSRAAIARYNNSE